MPVTLICPNLRCRTVLKVPDEMRGQTARCSRCGRAFVVPQSAAARRPPQPSQEPVSNEEPAPQEKT